MRGVVVLALLAACGSPTPPHIHHAPSPFAVSVEAFNPGDNGGFGSDALPDVALGPPEGGASDAVAGLDIVSLGTGGTIIVKLGEEMLDGPGTDLIVFENPFVISSPPADAGPVDAGVEVFSEPGEVSVSDDGVTFTPFPCAPADPEPNGCAGYGVVRANKVNGFDATDPAVAGGDDFDLADIGVERALYVRVVDKGTGGAPPKAGFDFDAVAVAKH